MVTAKKKDVEDHRRRLAQMMRRLLVEFRGRLDEELRPYGITTALMKLLWAIRQMPGSSGAQLARLCDVTPQSAQSLIQQAEVGGWIVRGKDKVNDRILTASLTAEGEEMLTTADRVVRSVEAKLWKGISERTIVELSGVLEQCLTNIAAQ